MEEKYPHLKFIQALICGGTAPDDILVELNKYNLPFPADNYNAIQKDLKKMDPEFFKKTSKKNFIDRDVADILDIVPMLAYKFNYPAGMDISYFDKTFEMLENNNIRIFLYVMFMADLKIDEIELSVNEKFDINASTKAIQSYRHYFFNLNKFTYKEKQELEKEFRYDINSRRLFKVALRGDKDYTLWKLGAAPQKSLNAMLDEMMTDSFYMFKEKVKQDPDTATKLGGLALKLADKIDRINDDKDKSDNLFEALNFDDEDEEISSKKIISSDEIDLNTTPVFLKEAKPLPDIEEDKTPVNLDDYNG